MKALKSANTPIAIGALLRLLLLIISIPVTGYYGGDATRYLDSASAILNGTWTLNSFWYPPAYPVTVALFLKLFGNLWALSFFKILIFIWFSLWAKKKLELFLNHRWTLACLWFLALDPIWLTQTALIGADFIGAVIFGVVLLELWTSKEVNPKTAVFLGLLCALSVFVKTVYLWTPLLLALLFFIKEKPIKKVHKIAIAAYLISAFLPVGIYSGLRLQSVGTPAISGHDSSLFGRYIVGYIDMARGTSGNIYDAMDSAAKRRPQEISWGKYTAQSISENKKIFAKLLTTSILKTALGHANVQFAYYFTGREVQGPGMLTPNSASETKQNSSISEKILWYLGVLICLVEKILLLSLALWGGHKLFYGGRPWHSISLMLMLGYFALTPVVFGEPRYFLPGTLVALILGAYSNNQFTKSIK